MRKSALLATALIFAGANLAFAFPVPTNSGQGISSSDGSITLVRDTKKSKKAKKSSTSGGGGMNMQGMPPGHKM
jgi:hypothetical protein